MKTFLSLTAFLIISFLIIVLKKAVFIKKRNKFEASKLIYKKSVNDLKPSVFENFSFYIEEFRQLSSGYFITLLADNPRNLNKYANYSIYFAQKKFNADIKFSYVLADGKFKEIYKDSTLMKKTDEFYNINKNGENKNFTDYLKWLR